MKEKDYFTIPEAADFCFVARTTMWRWVKSGKIKASTTLGGQHRIRKNDLQAALAEKGVYPLPGNGENQQTAISEINSSQKKILIVDDDSSIRKMLIKILELSGLQTDVAADGFEAGVKLVQFNPDLVLLDLYMPGMDGFEVCKRIKENPSTSRIRVLAVTGHDTEENRARIMKAGADAYMAKPLQTGKLLQEVEVLLSESVSPLAACVG